MFAAIPKVNSNNVRLIKDAFGRADGCGTTKQKRYWENKKGNIPFWRRLLVNFTNILRTSLPPIFLRQANINTFQVHKSCSKNVGEIDTWWNVLFSLVCPLCFEMFLLRLISNTFPINTFCKIIVKRNTLRVKAYNFFVQKCGPR